ncbi:hypothetical protein ABT052_37845 [Streptomyces sp. NPDC002766]
MPEARDRLLDRVVTPASVGTALVETPSQVPDSGAGAADRAA